jgi:hypothetical protein
MVKISKKTDGQFSKIAGDPGPAPGAGLSASAFRAMRPSLVRITWLGSI